MKKAQTLIEYALLMGLFTLICLGISSLLNREAIIRGGTFGVEVKNEELNREQVHVPPIETDEDY